MFRVFQAKKRSKGSAAKIHTVNPHLPAHEVEVSGTTPPATALENSPETSTLGNNFSTGDKTKNLWDQAFQILREDPKKRKRLNNYEEIVLSELEVGHGSIGGTSHLNDQNREDQLATLVSKKLQVIDDARLKFHRGEKTVEVAAQIDRLIKAVLFAKDFISSAAGSEPHVALAWAGISVLLPVLLNPSTQRAALVQGLDQVSDLLCRYRVVEETYCQQLHVESASPTCFTRLDKVDEPLRTNITKLYSRIIWYQVQIICQTERSKGIRYLRDVFKTEDWAAMLREIQEADIVCKDHFSVLDSSLLQKGFSDQKRRAEDLFAVLTGKLEALQHDTSELSKEMKDNEEERREWRRSEVESKCLQTLYTSDYKAFKARNPDRVPGTCQWFFGNEKYRNWLANASSDLLWVTADPGCGKSVLSASLIDHEFRQLSPNITCHFFFKDDNRDQKSATKAICALLHQILDTCNNPALLKKAVNVFHSHGRQMSESFQTLWGLLLDIAGVQTAGEILCVLDALDECEENGRESLIKSLNSFLSTMKDQTGRLKFIITSRHYYHIEERFSDRIIRLAGEDETKLIQRDIDLVVRFQVPQIARQMKLDIVTQDVLQKRLLEAQNRTYLWLHLTLKDVIKRSPEVKTPKRMERFLDNVPATLHDAYEHILDNSPDIETARKLLHIIVAAVRPLTLREMNTALNIQENNKSLKDLDLIPEAAFPSHVRNICGLFVSIYDSKVYLLHQTAKEFLVSRQDVMRTSNQMKQHKKTWEHSIDLGVVNLTMARVCLNYLMLEEFEHSPLILSQDGSEISFNSDSWFSQAGSEVSSINATSAVSEADGTVREIASRESETDEKVYTSNNAGFPCVASSNYLCPICDKEVYRYCDQHHFLDYASVYWVRHFHLAISDSSLEDQWLEVCNTESERFGTWFQVNYVLSPPPSLYRVLDDYSMPFNSLAVASFFGHNTMVERLCKVCQVNSADTDGVTALWWATRNGQESTVKLLLEKGAVQTKRKDGFTPLMLAAASGYDQKVALLVRNGAIIDSRANDGRTALITAISCGHETTTRLLLDSGAGLDERDLHGRSPLSYAAGIRSDCGGEAILRLLMERGAKIDLTDHDGRSPLLHAAEGRRWEAVELFLEKGVSINSRGDNGRSPLSYAAEDGNGKIVKHLLEAGADTESIDLVGRTPLRYAVCKAVPVLVFEIKASNGIISRDTPIVLAAKSGYTQFVHLILEQTDKPLAPTRKQQSLREMTSRYKEVIRLLMEHGADPETGDSGVSEIDIIPG